MRYLPRRVIDYTVAAEGEERTLLDNLLMSYGARDWYLPIWYDVTVSTAPSTTTFIPCSASSGLRAGSIIFIKGVTVYDYQVAEVASVNSGGVTLVAPIAAVPAGTILHPMTVGRLVEQPAQSAHTDGVVTAEPQFLVVERPFDAGTTIRDAGPMIMNGLIVNAYHQETGRGGYFHHNSGTSEGQFIFIYSLFLAYEALIGGNPEQQATARYYKTLAQTMLDAMGSGDSYLGPMLRQPVPSSVDTITLLHWLFAARGDIPGQQVMLSYEVSRVGSTLTIPANAGGGSTFKVWQIYPGSSALLYESPFSPAFNIATPTVETQIELTEADWTQLGDTTVITIPSGSPVHSTWKIVFGYNTDTLIPQGDGFEAYPNWTSIEPGYAACAPDTFRWFEQAMQKAIEHDDRPGMAARWTALQLAMRRTAVKGQNISDLREVFQPMPGFDAIPLRGAPDGMYCYSNDPRALGPSAGGSADWKGFTWWSRDTNGLIVGKIPEDRVDKTIEPTPSVRAKSVWTLTGVWPSVYFGPATTLTVGGVSYTFANEGQMRSTVDAINAGHPLVSATLVYRKTYLGEGDSDHFMQISVTARDDGVAGNGTTFSATTGTVSSPTLTGGVDAGPDFQITYNAWQVQIGRGFSDQWRQATDYQTADQFLYARIGATKKPGSTEHIRVYLSATQAYDAGTRWFAEVGSLSAFNASGGVAEFFIPLRAPTCGAVWGTDAGRCQPARGHPCRFPSHQAFA